MVAAFVGSEAWAAVSALVVGINTQFGDSNERTLLAELIGFVGCIVLIPAGWIALLGEGTRARLVTVAAALGLAAIAARATSSSELDGAAFLLLGLPAWLLLVAVGVLVWRTRSP
jgi:hypothetical protein